jgi:hypothetical protein
MHKLLNAEIISVKEIWSSLGVIIKTVVLQVDFVYSPLAETRQLA